MNDMYGTPLFEKTDLIKAYNYLIYSKEYDDICPSDRQAYELYTFDEIRKNSLLVRANMKKIQYKFYYELYPKLSSVLKNINQNHGLVVINPSYFIDAFNPFRASIIDKCMPYIASEMMNMSTFWIYFDGFVNVELEQIIKLKYRDYVLCDGDRTYIKLLPQDSFSLIYDLIDDIFHYC